MTYVPVLVGSTEFLLLEGYCLGKGWLFSLFFGWRKTIDQGINGQWAYYKISRKDWKEISRLVKEHEEAE